MSNKDRLYICLYARGGQPTMPGLEDTYHWAFIVGPKNELPNSQGMRYHAKEVLESEGFQWRFEKRAVSVMPTSMLLVRIMIAKIKDRQRLEAMLSQVPIRAGSAGWNCVYWVKEALEMLESDGKTLGTRVTGWTEVRNASMEYCQRKRDQGRFSSERYNPEKAPTYDLIQQVETID